MTPRNYEITFAGEAVPAVMEAFEDFDVSVGAGSTTLRAQLPDQAALHGPYTGSGTWVWNYSR